MRLSIRRYGHIKKLLQLQLMKKEKGLLSKQTKKYFDKYFQMAVEMNYKY